METLTFTRKEMASLLLSLNGTSPKSPLGMIQDIWRLRHQHDLNQGTPMTAFISMDLPPVLERMIKSAVTPAFSLHEIVSLGAQIEYTHFSATSIQNWVKRDFKDYIGLAEEGKKYSLQQVALIFIIEDLRSALDYESIRKFFDIVFHVCDKKRDALIQPLDFYATYSDLFEDLDARFNILFNERNDTINKWDHLINEVAKEYVALRTELTNDNQKATLQNAIHIAMISVHTSSFHSLARRYVNGMVFLHDLH
ncbi:DUF1836 domain-containing protein [Paenibacillus abyssi]|uniref:DUF1836 domain-containing protein n=1 Tax=Paenibacillus abyssi TaxID=1340531 RepID=A0A917FY25_9BACL|nr:DUF1836 domain-containing protein [Paenibacillus abyssi]GGG13311.1 hypothetical protein GCM10010916_32830 [Paenibacillus abyssi]